MDHPFARPGRPAHDILVTDEQLHLLARKRGFEAVATWAAECMNLSAREAISYEQGIALALLDRAADMRLLCRIQTDLERAGKPALSSHAGTIFANAVAEALSDLQGHASAPAADLRSPRPGRNTTVDNRTY